jgi:hypothetical protein
MWPIKQYCFFKNKETLLAKFKLLVRVLVKDPGCSSQISDPGSRFFHPGSQIWIPDPGVQKSPDPQHCKNTNFFQNVFKEKIKPETTNFNLQKTHLHIPSPPSP